MAITDITLSRITDPNLLKKLAGKRQFRGISDELLFKLAHRITVFRIPSRWEAINLIIANNILIPVVKPPDRSGKK